MNCHWLLKACSSFFNGELFCPVRISNGVLIVTFFEHQDRKPVQSNPFISSALQSTNNTAPFALHLGKAHLVSKVSIKPD